MKKCLNLMIFACLSLAFGCLVSCSDDDTGTSGGVNNSGGEDGQPLVFFCGDNMVYMIDVDAVSLIGSYTDGVLWSWDATVLTSSIGVATSKCTQLDDCKFVDGDRVLLTSSQGWCVLLDIKTKDILFYTTACTSAHSAELLPGNRLVTANSTGSSSANNSIQLYDLSRPNEVLAQYELYSAHGAAWNDATQRLYTLGDDQIVVYKLADWDTSSPSLEYERTIMTPNSGNHDLRCVDSGTLTLSGKSAFLYDISGDTWTEMKHFVNMSSVKSLNYNPSNGEVWYTDTTNPEGDYTWSTYTIRHVAHYNNNLSDRLVKVPDINGYKVRVIRF